MSRSVYVSTGCGCAMPAISRLADQERFEKAAEAQLAKRRRKPVVTQVGKYVATKSPALARRLHKVLAAHAKVVARKAKALYAERLAKDVGPKRDIVRSIVMDLASDDLGLTLEGELAPAMLAAFRRAAARGVTQVGMEMDEGITEQVDKAAVAYAERRGGELIKDLAGTTDDALQALLSRAVEDGMAPADLSDAVEELGAFGEARADTIARTELAFAHVQGNKEGWAAGGQVVGKRSVLGDLHEIDDICDDAADAGVVGIDEPFVDGADDPPYHPNCVCDIEPVLSEADEPAEE